MNTKSVTVVIPLGPAETDEAALLQSLALFPAHWQLLLAACPGSQKLAEQLCQGNPRWQMCLSDQGRAAQMNQAVAQSQGHWLWFVHVDTRLTLAHINQVSQRLGNDDARLCCFPLKFARDGPLAMPLNTLGANLRTRWLGVPFGDQGFLLRRCDFVRAGQYNEQAAYGEDHLLVWQLRCIEVPLHIFTEPLMTSARRYQRQGWWALTLIYQYRWLRQAFPWGLKRLGQRLRSTLDKLPGADRLG